MAWYWWVVIVLACLMAPLVIALVFSAGDGMSSGTATGVGGLFGPFQEMFAPHAHEARTEQERQRQRQADAASPSGDDDPDPDHTDPNHADQHDADQHDADPDRPAPVRPTVTVPGHRLVSIDDTATVSGPAATTPAPPAPEAGPHPRGSDDPQHIVTGSAGGGLQGPPPGWLTGSDRES